MTAALTTGFEPLPDLAVLEKRWRALEAADAYGSFFTRWTWTGSWLRATGVRPELLAVRDADGRDVALALIGRSVDRRKLGSVPMLRFNEAGDPQADRAFIEHNVPLCRKDRYLESIEALGQALGRRRDWRVLRLSGMEVGEPLVAAIPARRRLVIAQTPEWFVDLKAVRGAGGDYLSLLSANTRGQIKRSAKDYPGPASATVARDAATVAEWLEAMRALNAGRHADNAWDEPVFRAFIGEIAVAGLADGSVEVLRVAAGEALLGYLVNFREGGLAMNYQSAFAEPVSAKAKPGLMTHAAAVAHHVGRGLDRYSLLVGTDRYKESLSTGGATLEWWSVERFSLALEAEYWLRWVWGR